MSVQALARVCVLLRVCVCARPTCGVSTNCAHIQHDAHVLSLACKLPQHDCFLRAYLHRPLCVALPDFSHQPPQQTRTLHTVLAKHTEGPPGHLHKALMQCCLHVSYMMYAPMHEVLLAGSANARKQHPPEHAGSTHLSTHAAPKHARSSQSLCTQAAST